MKKYRFKTKEEFIRDNLWIVNNASIDGGYPEFWESIGEMNKFLGEPIDPKFNKNIESERPFYIEDWVFTPSSEVVEIESLTIEESLKNFNLINNSLITKTMKKTETKKAAKVQIVKAEENNIKNDFVFMDKTLSILEVGMITRKNVVLYGPGGHGKSEITMAFLKEKGIDPYVITMGTGMTTDRLFGGLNIPTFEASGKIEYLVENSFMNHEYVIFEEMFDAPDFILEQLKDILSSGIFRNGTQIFPIKTKFIICCTNRTRDEFSKNMSLKALMERFPLELNVVWDNYTDHSYNKLLESKYGEGEVDPIIPFLLQEYAKNSIIISPRVAVIAYQIYNECGPESLTFIAEFAKKPSLINEAIVKFEGMFKFRELSSKIGETIKKLTSNAGLSNDEDKQLTIDLDTLRVQIVEIKSLKISDDIAHQHSQIVKSASDVYKNFEKRAKISSIVVED
jgi:hypothetical protein